MNPGRVAGATLAMLFSVVVTPAAFAQAESQVTLVKKGQRANGLALEYARTAGNTEYLKELSPECYAILDVPVTIHQDYETVFGAGDVQKADLVRGGATILVPGWQVTEDFRIPVFAQLTSSYSTIEGGSSDNEKQGTELSDFLMGTGLQYRDWGILHAGLIQSKETVYSKDLKTSEKEGEYNPFVSLLLPFADVSINTLGGLDYLNLEAGRLGRYARIPSTQKGFAKTNNLSLGFTRLGPAGQNNLFVRGADILGYVDLGLEVDPVAGELRALTGGVSYLWEWTRMFVELRVAGSMYKDQRITERAQMIGNLSAAAAEEETDPVMGGRVGVHLGLKRDYLYGPRDLSWYDRLVPSRGVFEMSFNDKEILQGFYEAYNHPTGFGKVIWDFEPGSPYREPPRDQTATEVHPLAPSADTPPARPPNENPAPPANPPPQAPWIQTPQNE